MCQQLKFFSLQSSVVATRPVGNVTRVCLINARDMEVSHSNPDETFHSLSSAYSNKNRVIECFF